MPVDYLIRGFLVLTFNHELAIIMATWLVIDSIVSIYAREGRWPNLRISLKTQQLAIAYILVMSGLIVINVLQSSLMIVATDEHVLIQVYKDLGIKGWCFTDDCILWSLFPFTLDLLKITFLFDPELRLWAERFGLSYPAIYAYPLLIFSIPVIAIKTIFLKNDLLPRIGSCYLFMWTALFAIDIIYEIRLWLPFVPFLVLMIPLICWQKRNYNLTI